MKYWALLILGAVSPYLFDSTLPWRAGLIVLLALTITYLTPLFFPSIRLTPLDKFLNHSVVRRGSLCLLVFSGMFMFTTYSLQERLEQRLPVSLDKAEGSLTGVVRGLPEAGPDNLRFQFLVDSYSANTYAGNTYTDKTQVDNNSATQLQEALAGQLVRVYWHLRKAPSTGLPILHPGERWQLPMQLRTNRAQVNFVGSDNERWSFANGVAARGFVLAAAERLPGATSWFDTDRWREAVLTKMKLVAGDAAAFRMLAALAIADRRELDASDRQVFAATGTGHLLAISGLHIGLAAVIGYFVGRLLLLFFVAGMRLRLAISLPWVGAWLSAFSYAVLAGFGVSTQRALIMLSVATIVVLCRRKIHPASAWMVAMALVLIIDPFAPLRAGFWFSFLAVGVLLIIFTPRFGEIPAWKKMLFAQLGITLTMAPLGMYFFQQSSLPGLLANLIAIPTVSFISVPLILFGLIFMWLPGPMGGWLLEAAGMSLHYLFVFLQQLSTWQPDFMQSASTPKTVAVILAMLGALILIMPRGLPGRAIGLLLMLPMFLPPSNPLAEGMTEVDMLDVGQGLAILVGNKDYLMVYDTGPGNGLQDAAAWDTVKGSIQPAIARRTIAPDLIVASHADLDHAGGLDSLRNIWPQATVTASLPQTTVGVQPCLAGDLWGAGEMSLRVLHPAAGLPYLGNDSSCVISVNSPGFSLLLTGDISKAVESRLVLESVSNHQFMSVPHHGSASSSTRQFIETVHPQLALNSAASNNRFDFPRPEVLQRFDKVGINVLNTAGCGGLRITSTSNADFQVRSARVHRDAIWRFKADDICP